MDTLLFEVLITREDFSFNTICLID